MVKRIRFPTQRAQRAHLIDSVLNSQLTKRAAIFICICEVLLVILMSTFKADNPTTIYMAFMLQFIVFVVLFRSIRKEWIIMKELEAFQICQEVMDS
jgi:low temperature requirement protein LtrA